MLGELRILWELPVECRLFVVSSRLMDLLRVVAGDDAKF